MIQRRRPPLAPASASGYKTRVRRPALVSFGCVLALGLGCARPGHFDPATLDPTSAAALAAAADDYRTACAPCHGIDGRGTGPVAASLKRPPADLTLLAVRHGGTFSFDDTVAVITNARAIDAHGTRAMPVWNIRLGGGDAASAVASIAEQRRIDMVARYVATLQRPAPAPSPSPRPHAGSGAVQKP